MSCLNFAVHSLLSTMFLCSNRAKQDPQISRRRGADAVAGDDGGKWRCLWKNEGYRDCIYLDVYVCECMYVNMCIRVHACNMHYVYDRVLCMCVCVRVRMCMSVCMQACMHVCVYIVRAYIQPCERIRHECMLMCIPMCMYVCII